MQPFTQSITKYNKNKEKTDTKFCIMRLISFHQNHREQVVNEKKHYYFADSLSLGQILTRNKQVDN